MSERRSFSAEEARSLLRRARTGTLATLNADDGTPYASLVNLATDVQGRPVILVSKDINMRIKARAIGVAAEDYFNDKVLEDTDILYTGTRPLPANFWDKHGKGMESWKKEAKTYYRVKGPLCPQFLVNEFVWQEGPQPLQAWVKVGAGKTAP